MPQALRTLCALVPFQLPSLPQFAAALLERTLALLRRAADFAAVSDVVGICLKVLTALLREARPSQPRPPAVAAPAAAASAEDAANADFELGGEIEETRMSGGAKLSEAQLRAPSPRPSRPAPHATNCQQPSPAAPSWPGSSPAEPTRLP